MAFSIIGLLCMQHVNTLYSHIAGIVEIRDVVVEVGSVGCCEDDSFSLRTKHSNVVSKATGDRSLRIRPEIQKSKRV